MTATIFDNIGSMVDVLSVSLLIGAFMMLSSTHRAFLKGHTKNIALFIMISATAFLVMRILTLVSVQIFDIASHQLIESFMGAIVAIFTFMFAIKFNRFAAHTGFALKEVEKPESDKKIAKALGGE